MLKHLKQQKVSKSTYTETLIKSFSGATTRDMKDYIKPVQRRNPEKVILHIGTNDIPTKEASVILGEEEDISNEIKRTNPKATTAVSEIITREDNCLFQAKVKEVNKLLKSHFNKHKSALYRYVLHLSPSGASLLARNINHIK